MRKFFPLVLILVLFSCKSKKGITNGIAVKEITTSKIIQGHYKNKQDFKQLRYVPMQNIRMKDNPIP